MRLFLLLIIGCVCCLSQFHCQTTPAIIPSSYSYVEPDYGNISFQSQSDSLHFALSENSYNQIKSYNCFEEKGKSYISFYDGRSETINIYDFNSQKLEKQIQLQKWFPNREIYKLTIYVKSLDSIFIADYATLYLFDSTGKAKKSIKFFVGTDALAYFSNDNPPIFAENSMYMGVRPQIDETSASSLQKWRLLYKFDLNAGTKELYYSLPDIYQKNIYGDNFLKYSYCYNDKGNFVFSFPADTAIYETNLSDYHKSYNAKSLFHDQPIPPVTISDLKNDDGYRQYRLRDSYGSIYYNSLNKRYFRLARRKMSPEEYEAENEENRYGFVVLDQNFKIIGETPFSSDYSYRFFFFRPDGTIYTRVNQEDEYTIHFVKLSYKEDPNQQAILSQVKTR